MRWGMSDFEHREHDRPAYFGELVASPINGKLRHDVPDRQASARQALAVVVTAGMLALVMGFLGFCFWFKNVRARPRRSSTRRGSSSSTSRSARSRSTSRAWRTTAPTRSSRTRSSPRPRVPVHQQLRAAVLHRVPAGARLRRRVRVRRLPVRPVRHARDHGRRQHRGDLRDLRTTEREQIARAKWREGRPRGGHVQARAAVPHGALRRAARHHRRVHAARAPVRPTPFSSSSRRASRAALVCPTTCSCASTASASTCTSASAGGAQDIGTWQTVFAIMSGAAVVTNGAQLVFTMDTFDALPGDAMYDKAWLFIVFQYVMFGLMFLLALLVDDVPEGVAHAGRAHALPVVRSSSTRSPTVRDHRRTTQVVDRSPTEVADEDDQPIACSCATSTRCSRSHPGLTRSGRDQQQRRVGDTHGSLDFTVRQFNTRGQHARLARLQIAAQLRARPRPARARSGAAAGPGTAAGPRCRRRTCRPARPKPSRGSSPSVLVTTYGLSSTPSGPRFTRPELRHTTADRAGAVAAQHTTCAPRGLLVEQPAHAAAVRLKPLELHLRVREQERVAEVLRPPAPRHEPRVLAQSVADGVGHLRAGQAALLRRGPVDRAERAAWRGARRVAAARRSAESSLKTAISGDLASTSSDADAARGRSGSAAAHAAPSSARRSRAGRSAKVGLSACALRTSAAAKRSEASRRR